MTTLGERIVSIRKTQPQKMSQTKFAESLGLTRAAVSTYELNIVIPSDAVLKLISQTYRVDYRWLCTGEGDMTITADTVEQAVDRFMAGASEFQRSTFKALADMGDEQWEWLKTLVDSIAGQQKCD